MRFSYVDHYGRSDLQQLATVLEHKEIVYESPGRKRSSSAVGRLYRQPLDAAVWATIATEGRSNRAKRQKTSFNLSIDEARGSGISNPNVSLIKCFHDRNPHIEQDIQPVSNFSVFATVYLVDWECDSDCEELESVAVQLASIEKEDMPSGISEDDWSQVIIVVSSDSSAITNLVSLVLTASVGQVGGPHERRSEDAHEELFRGQSQSQTTGRQQQRRRRSQPSGNGNNVKTIAVTSRVVTVRMKPLFQINYV